MKRKTGVLGQTIERFLRGFLGNLGSSQRVFHCFRISILALILLHAIDSANADEPCIKSVEKILQPAVDSRRTLTDPLKNTESALNRKLNSKEQEALKQASSDSEAALAYTSEQVVQQNKALKKAGFSENEITKLRNNGILGNSVISYANGSPVGVEVLAAPFKPLASKSLRELNEGKVLQYLVGEDGKIYVAKVLVNNLPSNKVLVATSKVDNADTLTVVREAGNLRYNSELKTYIFEPSYGFDTSKVEVKEIIDNISALNPGSSVKYAASSNIPASRVLNCLEIASAQSKGKNFVLDRLLTDNLITTTAIVGSEVYGAGRLNTEHGRQVVIADLLGGNINNLIGSQISKHLVLKNTNLLTSMITRTGMGLSMIELQKQVHKSAVQEESSKTAEEIANFNRAHFFARLPINHAVDNFMIHNLPGLVFDRCQKNPALSVLISPRSVRLYERVGSTVIYYGLRQAIVGQ